MQGPRGAVGSLPETLCFDHGSMSTDAGLDQQIFWNNMRNSAHIMSPGDTSITFWNSTSQEGQNLNAWIGEPSSSNMQNQAGHNEQNSEHGWSSSMRAGGGAGPIAEEQQNDPASILLLNNDNINLGTNQLANGHFFLQSSSSIPQDLNINAAFAEHGGDDCQLIERPDPYKSGGLDNTGVPSATMSSLPFQLPSGSGGYLVQENDDPAGFSFEGRRCKRKVLEGNVGQSSGTGSSNYFQPAEDIGWHRASTRFNAGSSLSISTPLENALVVNPSEQVNPSLGLGVGGAASESSITLNPAGSAESSRRNFRLRINASHQQDPITRNVFPTGSATGHSNASSSHHSARLPPLNNFSDSRSAPAPIGDTNPQGQPVLRVPALRRNLQSSRWNRGSTSRPGSSSYVASSMRDAPLEFNSRSMPRNILEHPMFVPATEIGNSTQNPTNWSLAGGNISTAGNVASRTGSSSGGHSSSSPNRVFYRSSPQNPRRLSEFVRRSLLSSTGSESVAQSSNHSLAHTDPSASTQEMALSSGVANQGHRRSHSRSTVPLERQLDGTFAVPYSFRNLPAASEGRSRLVSEIRSVLDLMRRGEGLRFEDVMILDQSVFFGMPDIHDRHRDMRLDVDNMSYEELLALEDRIGNVCTGLSEETILNRLKQRKYIAITTEGQAESEACCICQEEYKGGDDLGMLECGHDFHNNCVKQWLMQKNSCPICKTTALPK